MADSCTREWPGEYDPKIHRIYPRVSGSGGAIDGASNTKSQEEARIPLKDRLLGSFSKSHLNSAEKVTINQNYQNRRDSTSSESIDVEARTGQAAACKDGKPAPEEVEDAARVLNFLTWGRYKISDVDGKAEKFLREPHMTRNLDSSPWQSTNGFTTAEAAQIAFLQLLLPSTRQILGAVDYSDKCLLWYHGAYHAPTFRKELQEALTQCGGSLRIERLNLQWAALLFAVLASCMVSSPIAVSERWGFHKNERAKLSKEWYKAAVSCLHVGGYMSNHNLYAVQAICTLTLSAHTLGFSADQSILIGAGLRLAQSLGLHRLAHTKDETIDLEQEPDVLPDELYKKTLTKLLGRRLWMHVCCHDWFSIPFAESYNINLLHFTTIKPAHLDDDTMKVLPADQPSLSSYLSFLFDIASLLPQLQDAFVASNTTYTKYEAVLEFDSKMRALANEKIPKMYSMKEPLDPSWPEYIHWARRSITICIAHKLMMIHRKFLGRSFTNPAFAFTRRTCCQAAKTILKEAKQVHDDEGPTLWIDTAFSIAAGITLSLDLLHRTKDEPEYDEHRRLIEGTIDMLQKFDNSVIAKRGISLLTSLLTEHQRMETEAANTPASNTDTSKTPIKRKRSSAEKIVADGAFSSHKREKLDLPKIANAIRAAENATNSPNTLTDPKSHMPPTMGTHLPQHIARYPLPAEPLDTPPRSNMSPPNNPEDAANNESNNFTSVGGFDMFGVGALGVLGGSNAALDINLNYQTFQELFPPQTGFGNQFFFEDLLNFEGVA